MHLHLKPDAKPYQSRPYAVPHLHRQLFKNELDRLVEQEVLAPADLRILRFSFHTRNSFVQDSYLAHLIRIPIIS